ncbi:MAG TPA: MFS transporter [Herbaspirillum sp.]
MNINQPAIGAIVDRPLNKNDVKTLSLAALGGALEYYDFIVAVFFTKLLAGIFFPPDMPTWLAQLNVFALFAAGYLVRPIGGLFFAHFGDRIGRKKMFALSLFLMAAPTFAMGLLPSYTQIGLVAPVLLLFCRLLQGFSVGGEVPGAWVFVSEHVSEKKVGLACGLLMSGICFGILLGSLTALLLNAYMEPSALGSWGWRVPFLVGGLFGFMAVYLRRHLQETPVFERLNATKALSKEIPLAMVLRDNRGEVLLGFLATWFFSGTFVTYFLYLPTYLQVQFSLGKTAVLNANSWSVLLLIIGSTVTGILVDKATAGKALFFGCIAMLATVFLLFKDLLAGSPDALTILSVGGFFMGIITVVPFVIVKSFPPRVRFTGFSLSYNMGYAIFGGTAPVMLAAFVGQNHVILAPAYYLAAMGILGLLLSLNIIRRKL